jgi:hypothetical protein
VVSPSTCGSVTFDPSGLPPWIGPATQGNLQSAYGSSTTCQGYGWGAPGWCGGYADCCSDYCQAGGLAVPTCQ